MNLEQIESKITELIRIHRERLGKLEKYYCDFPSQEKYIECIKLGEYMRGLQSAHSLICEARANSELPLGGGG